MSLPETAELGFLAREGSQSANGDWIGCDGRLVGICFQRNPRAKRYRLYVDHHGRPRVTIPQRGTRRDAGRFLERHREWLIEQLRRFERRRNQTSVWRLRSEILLHGVPCRLERNADPTVRQLSLGECVIPVPDALAGENQDALNFRPLVESFLRRMATEELPLRVQELADGHDCADGVKRVTIRNQRSRWGSCSRRGTVSLNWRLIQVPPAVRDYIILHELMHLREMNHSSRFWAQVEGVCPDYRAAEAWLRAHFGLLRRI